MLLFLLKEGGLMRKPILIKLDTVTNLSEALYSNIVYSEHIAN
ncbi:hypothetical protein [Clostridium neonatale]|uniref:Uncharacterized protein n=1 Tax=Clostridium neonatale TaxID=137838 RepID=A0AA86K0J9_9CLOT|nr:hypothetical protein CNEO_45378 [Clostridium neonatale]